MSEPGAILGIDPGTRKCGYAIVDSNGVSLEQGIVGIGELGGRIAEIRARIPLRAVALGGGTHTAAVAPFLEALGVPVHVVDERETTLLARRRYFAVHPPAGWRRLVPRGLLLPPGPIDDFAALLIAERLLERESTPPRGAKP